MMPRFIVLEGLDGSGKSTQISLLSQHMSSLGLAHITTREPSDGAIGTLVRKSLSHNPLENETLALLFAADRYQHVHDVVTPALCQGKHVLCDRFYYSNLAYQAQGPESIARIMAYNQVIMTRRRPDAVFFLDVNPEECMERIAARNQETTLYENITRLQKDRARFLCGFEKMNDNITILDCNSKSETQVFEELWRQIENIERQSRNRKTGNRQCGRGRRSCHDSRRFICLSKLCR